jgi:hypothetical protein
MKLRVTVTFEYEPDGQYYDDTTPSAMAETDQRNFQNDPKMLAEDLADLGYQVKVEPVEE